MWEFMMNEYDSAPYATCNHCGWHGKREQLVVREYGDDGCPKCRSADTVTTADATREEFHRTRYQALIDLTQALAVEQQRLNEGVLLAMRMITKI